MEIVNLTPHDVHLNNGKVYPVSGQIARVHMEHSPFDENNICISIYGEIRDLPLCEHGVCYIVSTIVAKAAGRIDLLVPATGHPECKRDENGHIVSVPGFIRMI